MHWGFLFTFVVMKLFLSCFFTISTLIGFCQSVKLKNRFLKFYKGNIPAYEVNYNNQLVKIDATEIMVQLKKDSLYISVGASNWVGIYTVAKTGKKVFEITGKMEGTGIPEVLNLNTRNKTIVRKGLFPQPDAELKWSKLN